MASCYLSYRRPQWIWCVESFSSIKSTIAEEQTEHMGIDYKDNAQIKAHIAALAKAEKEICPVQIQAWLSKNAIQISNSMWVQRNDPTIIYVNDVIILYDRKDGWSNKKLVSIVTQWFWLIFRLKVKGNLANG
jgi:hypothetical protein